MPETSGTGGSIKDRVEAIVGSLGCAITQLVETDDKGIADRIYKAYDAARSVLSDLNCL